MQKKVITLHPRLHKNTQMRKVMRTRETVLGRVHYYLDEQ